MVYPLGFFQLEMHGGIFHSFCSFTVTLRGGEWSTGGGGDGGPADPAVRHPARDVTEAADVGQLKRPS